MAEFFVTLLVGMSALFLWLAVVALLLNLFGLRLPLGHLPHLSRPQYVLIYGVLGFGCGMLITTTVSHYVEWRYFHGSIPVTVGKFLEDAVWYPIVSGLLFGLITWNGRAAKKTP